MRKVFALGVLSLALVSAACGGNGTTASPTSPSPTVNAGVPPSSMSGAIVSGTVAASSSSGTALGPSALTALTVQVVGTSITSSVSSTGDFSLKDVPPGDVSIKVSGSGADAVVSVAGVQAGQTIQIRIVVSGSTGRLDFDSRGGASGKVELEGLVESKTAPDMLIVNGQSVKVVAVTTEIRKGNTPMTYADLAVGMRVHVRGTMSAPGITPPVLTADLIIVQNTGGGGGMSIDLRGTISGLAGTASCPLISFNLGSTPVQSQATTMFKPSCAGLKNGDSVDVKGMLVSGTLMASKIDRR